MLHDDFKIILFSTKNGVNLYLDFVVAGKVLHAERTALLRLLPLFQTVITEKMLFARGAGRLVEQIKADYALIVLDVHVFCLFRLLFG